MRTALAATFLIMVFMAALPASASSDGNWSLYPIVEIYDWREYDNDFRLLRETGTRYGIETKGDIPLHQDDQNAFLLRFKANLYFGLVNYDGHAMDFEFSDDLHPSESDVFYIGDEIQADVSWQVKAGELSVGPFAGLGYEWWLRDIRDGNVTGPPVNINGDAVSAPSEIGASVGGYEELWQVYSASFGIRGTIDLQENASFFFEGGGRFPFYTSNDANFPGLGWTRVEPEGELSAFAEAGINFSHLRASAYYKGLRFDRSDTVVEWSYDGLIPLSQPESRQDIVGFTVGVTF